MIRGSVKDADALAEYNKLWQPIADKFNAKIIAAGEHQTREGIHPERAAVLQFPSYESAQACYDDEAYQALMPAIEEAYGSRELVIIKGV